ncbi:uncharacterized protein OCT59_009627 [Rhizophagus irregularis]|uniref:uncharacterized protein n=1 Tax=Rhizophagus irregularis TaxID=588596 RepID=UPI001C1AD7B5|nr:hypothetical protein OCT59_009627 [Rhizophagus irregularis]CAB5183213.1 unnamed protein product [Rhizophagus irregularis]
MVFVRVVYATLTNNETTQQQMRKHKPLVEFIETHCQERAYSFQIKKLPSREKFRSSPINMESKTSDSRLTELKLGRVIHVWLVNTNSKGKSFSLN